VFSQNSMSVLLLSAFHIPDLDYLTLKRIKSFAYNSFIVTLVKFAGHFHQTTSRALCHLSLGI
jgi:hypothetical protein